MRLAIVEDDPPISSQVLAYGAMVGVTGEIFRSGRQFLKHVSGSGFDLALLDIRLPDINGLEVLEKLRAQEQLQARPIPVMVVTGCADARTMETAFDRGAMDYVVKPAKPDELLVRAKAIRRRLQPELFSEAPITVGPFLLNLGTLQVFHGEQEILLSAREFRLAWLLFQRRGEVVSRAEILRAVWGRLDLMASRTLDTHVGRLRKKLGLHGTHSVRLRPIYGVGYRLDVFL
jgi:DNA-binding response OmpR family regulator